MKTRDEKGIKSPKALQISQVSRTLQDSQQQSQTPGADGTVALVNGATKKKRGGLKSAGITEEPSSTAVAGIQRSSKVVKNSQDVEGHQKGKPFWLSAASHQQEETAMLDDEDEQAPPSSQPLPLEDDTTSEDAEDEVANSLSESSFEGEYSYTDLKDDVSSEGDESEADVDLELIEAEARRRLLAEELGDKSTNSDSEHGSNLQVRTTNVKSQTSKPADGRAAERNKSKQPNQPLTQSLIQQVEYFARGRAVWTVAQNRKEFNKILFPFIKNKQNLSQNDAVVLLTILREKWEAEKKRDGQKKQQGLQELKGRDERTQNTLPPQDDAFVKGLQAKEVRSAQIVAERKMRLAKNGVGINRKLSPPKGEVTELEDVYMEEAGPTQDTELMFARIDDAIDTLEKARSILKRKREGTEEEAVIEAKNVQPVPEDIEASAHASTEPQSTKSEKPKPSMNKTTNTKDAKRLKQETKAGKQAAAKLKLVGSKDWYSNDEEQALTVDIPITKKPEQAKPPRKKAKKGPTKSEHFTSSTNGNDAKAARAALVASLAEDLMKDAPRLKADFQNAASDDGEDSDREPVFFSSGAPVAVARVERAGMVQAKTAEPDASLKEIIVGVDSTNTTTKAQSKGSTNGKANPELKSNLSKRQKKRLARDLNREKQLALNKAKKEANAIKFAAESSTGAPEHDVPSVNTPISEALAQTSKQPDSFKEMARKAKAAVEAAAKVVAQTVADNARLKEQVVLNPSFGEGKKRKKRRNKNRLSAEYVEMTDTLQPLEFSATNKQNNEGGEVKERSKRRPRAHKVNALTGGAVEAAGQTSKDHHS